MEQVKDLYNWYINLFSNPTTRIVAWTGTLGTLTFLITFIIKPSRKFILNKLKRKKGSSVPAIKVKISRDSLLHPVSDKKFESKIILARDLFRSEKTKGMDVKVVPTFSIRKLDRYEKKAFQIKLRDISTEIEKKIEILLTKTIDLSIEYKAENIKTVINSLLQKPEINVTNRTKIEIFRSFDPKIDFPVYLTDDEMTRVATYNKTTVSKLIQDLRVPLMTTSIFPPDILLQQVIPAFVREIYRIHNRFSFNLDTPRWSVISSYDVGLG